MALEIERKFLIAAEGWRGGQPGLHCLQGYLDPGADPVVRLRLAGGRGFLALKAARPGLQRHEFEYEIPAADARLMLELFCRRPLIEKIRHLVEYRGSTWEIDEFLAENQGLLIAEIELASAEQDFARPPWLGREVTGDRRYYNAALVERPFASWS